MNYRELLNQAIDALKTRGYFSAYPESPSPKIYGETAKDEALARFTALKNNRFIIDGHPNNGKFVSSEDSPYGQKLGISYAQADKDEMIIAAQKAQKIWQSVDCEKRAEVCCAIIDRLNKHSFDMAFAIKETTGQGFMMAFQAGGPHAQDRALEAVAMGYLAQTATPSIAEWEKPMGKNPPLKMIKKYRIVGRGVGLVIAPATFPTWNGYPGLFANLITANATILKPHPMAILPLALTVHYARAVITEYGLDPNIILLAVDELHHEITKEYILDSRIGIIDYTGSSQFAVWIKQNALGKLIYTEESGVNSIVITGTDNFRSMCDNIAFSLALYSGQMCTAPQNIYIPKDGITSDQGHKSCAEVCQGLVDAMDHLLGDSARAQEICGAIANPATLLRIQSQLESWLKSGTLLRAGAALDNAKARTMTPYVVMLGDGDQAECAECFGPVVFIIKSETAQSAIARAAELSRLHGAITAGLYAQDNGLIDYAIDEFATSAVHLSINLVGQIFVNQSAAFSDYHVSGANPAGNACLTDMAFVANRFRIAAHRFLAKPID